MDEQYQVHSLLYGPSSELPSHATRPSETKCASACEISVLGRCVIFCSTLIKNGCGISSIIRLTTRIETLSDGAEHSEGGSGSDSADGELGIIPGGFEQATRLLRIYSLCVASWSNRKLAEPTNRVLEPFDLRDRAAVFDLSYPSTGTTFSFRLIVTNTRQFLEFSGPRLVACARKPCWKFEVTVSASVISDFMVWNSESDNLKQPAVPFHSTVFAFFANLPP